ncbi:MAG: dethiobiotin synthase [Rickettsiales bacterium]|nr:dethiobiotin synthase [Rickettsiales bacterium]
MFNYKKMNSNFFLNGFFVTGTDTNIGKTIVSAVLVNKLNANYWKPIQCGKDEENLTDSQKIKNLLNLENHKIYPETYVLSNPLSPNIAAKKENVIIDLEKLKKQKIEQNKFTIVEGAGGLLVPINEKYLVIDMIKYFKLPVILVAKTELGTINHTLLSLEVLANRSQQIKGIIFVGKNHQDTIQTIKYFSKEILSCEVKVLGVINLVNKINKNNIIEFGNLIKI